ncbi:MAG: BrnA antitoxin family protein [Acidobacteria bacterium]|jgi:hypothetical protein|nr:BrnA antitoxin family protein [Acidobacteriota bacterium]
MIKNKSKRLRGFKSLNKLVDFFDTHDLGDYWEDMPEINFEVDLRKRTHLFSLDSELAKRLTEIAKSRKISSQSILNKWLKEKILQQAC